MSYCIHNYRKKPIYVSLIFCFCFFLTAFTLDARAQEINTKQNTAPHQASERNLDNANHRIKSRTQADVLYYDWQTKIGIVESNDKIYKIKLNEGNPECEELECYPGELPRPNTHVQNYPDRLKRMVPLPARPTFSGD